MKKLRPIILAVIVLALTSLGLPAHDTLARISRRAASAHRRGNHRHCRHSRAWWRRYRRQVRERQAQKLRERRRRNEETALTPKKSSQRPANGAELFRKAVAAEREVQGPRNAFDFALPRTWKLAGADGRGTLKFNVMGHGNKAAGTATLSPVALIGTSAALDIVTPRTKALSGVPLPVLRRMIIDRMIANGGWVTNDFEREIDGRRVYVVTAQTGQGGVARESWTFYFTEIEGRLYNLATNAPVEMSAPVAADSEQLLATLRAGVSPSMLVKARE